MWARDPTASAGRTAQPGSHTAHVQPPPPRRRPLTPQPTIRTVRSSPSPPSRAVHVYSNRLVCIPPVPPNRVSRRLLGHVVPRPPNITITDARAENNFTLPPTIRSSSRSRRPPPPPRSTRRRRRRNCHSPSGVVLRRRRCVWCGWVTCRGLLAKDSVAQFKEGDKAGRGNNCSICRRFIARRGCGGGGGFLPFLADSEPALDAGDRVLIAGWGEASLVGPRWRLTEAGAVCARRRISPSCVEWWRGDSPRAGVRGGILTCARRDACWEAIIGY